MKPTKDNKDEFWWLDKGDGVPTVAQIDVATFGGEERVICRFVGWDIPTFVSSMENARWLGRAVPPEAPNDD